MLRPRQRPGHQVVIQSVKFDIATKLACNGIEQFLRYLAAEPIGLIYGSTGRQAAPQEGSGTAQPSLSLSLFFLSRRHDERSRQH